MYYLCGVMKKFVFLFAALFVAAGAWAQAPKYVFYFIGDGMGLPQVALAKSASGQELDMLNMPVLGSATTFCADSAITDSAAAGTALASGTKANFGTIGMSPSLDTLRTVAERAHYKGMKVGIISSVSIDHATPSAFYAHVPDRDMYEQIGNQLLASGFDYFAGGSPRWDKRTTLTTAAEFESAAAARGYTFADTRAELAAANGKVIATINMLGEGGYTDGESALPYAIDRPMLDEDNRTSLADFVRRGIELLDNPAGFFMMAEGGKIDWAGHANDAPASIHEVLDFDAAIGVALEFYAAHPDETLIVVTADHETGGLTLGRRDREYSSDFGSLMDITASGKATEEANREAGIDWTSGAHTALPVPVFSIGCGAENFTGFYDNTDIPKRIIKITEL